MVIIGAKPSISKSSLLSVLEDKADKTGIPSTATVNKGTTPTSSKGEIYGINADGTAGSRSAARWIANLSNGATTPTEGMMVTINVPAAGHSSYGTVLSIDGGQTYHPVCRLVGSWINTRYAVGSIITVVYNSNESASAYLNDVKAPISGTWIVVNDSDSNTTNSTGVSNLADTKLYLTGAQEQGDSGKTTYTNSNVYIGNDNSLYSNGSKVMTSADVPVITMSATQPATYKSGDVWFCLED